MFDWRWDFAFEILPRLLQATLNTLAAAGIGYGIAVVLGLVFALAQRTPSRHAASASSVAAPSAAPAARTLAPRGTSALSMRSAACSSRSTRAKPHAPPKAASDAA